MSLGEDWLDHLVCIRLEGPPAEKWDATSAVKLWWTDKTRRVNHPATHTKTCKEAEDVEHEKKGGLSLDDWETWLANEDDKTEDEDDEADGEDETEADGEDGVDDED